MDEILEILQKLDFFNQRAGRELWGKKPRNVQDMDIQNFSSDLSKIKDFIVGQQTEIDLLYKLILADTSTTATAIQTNHRQQQITAEYIKHLKEQISRLQDDMLKYQLTDIQSLNNIQSLTNATNKEVESKQ